MTANGQQRLAYAAGRPREQAITLLSSAARTLLKSRGYIRAGIYISSWKVEFDALTIGIHPPLSVQQWAQVRYLNKVIANPEALPFHLNIWAPNKVLHITQYGAELEIVSFRRGGWEKTLLDAARTIDHELVIPPIVLPMASGSLH